MVWASLMVVERTGTLLHPPRMSLKDELECFFPSPNNFRPANYSPAVRFPSLFVFSSSCLLALSRVVLRSLAFPDPADAAAECDCVFGAAIAIVPSGSRRFVLVVVVARTATVMSGGVHAGLLWPEINVGAAKRAPPFRCRLLASRCSVLQPNTPG